MVPTIAFIICSISFLFTIIGGTTHSFWMLTISITLASFSLMVFTVSFNKNSKHIKKEFRGAPVTVFRMVLLMLGVGLILISFLYLRDIPSYVQNDFRKIEGVPSSVEYGDSSRYGGGLDIVLKGEVYRIQSDRKVEKIEGKYFTIYVLPHSDWVVSYKISDKS